MSQQIFKFIAALPSISPAYNALLVAGDTILNAFSKLQGLLQERVTRNSITSTTTGGSNTTADFNIINLTIDPNVLQVGSVIQFDINILFTKDATNSSILFWIKNNAGTKILTVTLAAGTTVVTNSPIKIAGNITIRSIGASGTFVAEIDFKSRFTTVATSGGVEVLSTPSTIDTTISTTFTVGANMSVADTGSLITRVGGGIWLI